MDLGELFSKFGTVKNPIIRDFISSIPRTFSDTVSKTLSYPAVAANDFILNNRIKLQTSIRKFHLEADTMNTDVLNNISFLNNPNTQIFVSTHQPNLFAYSGVFKKIVLLQTLKNIVEKHDPSKRVINLFLIVDHDFLDEIWIHRTQLPSIRHSNGIFELRMPISKSNRWQLVCNVPRPGRTTMNCWKNHIYEWIRKNSSFLLSQNTFANSRLQLINNFDRFWDQVDLSYSKANSYSDFGSFLMSQIVNTIWCYDTLFVRLTDISAVFEDGFKYLISNFNTYSEALKITEAMFMSDDINSGVSSSSYLFAPLWLHCKCGSKAPLRITSRNKQQEPTRLDGICISCRKDLYIHLAPNFNLSRERIIRQLSPRALPIILLLSRDLGVRAYASGTDGLRYIVNGSIAFKELSVNMPLILVWPSKDVYQGFAQSEALELVQLKAQSDVLAYKEKLERQDAEYLNKINPLLLERASLIKAGKSIDAILSALFRIKQAQRKTHELIKILKKAINTLEVRPSIIDYAINFGMANIEPYWRQGLLTNDNLTAPLFFDQNTG